MHYAQKNQANFKTPKKMKTCQKKGFLSFAILAIQSLTRQTLQLKVSIGIGNDAVKIEEEKNLPDKFTPFYYQVKYGIFPQRMHFTN